MQKIFSLLFAAFLLAAVSAQAQAAVDAAGAETLKKEIADALSLHAKMSGSGVTMGEITVTPKDAFYEVTLPDVAYTFSNGGKAVIGTVVANAAPGEPGEYLVSVKLPATTSIQDQTNASVAEITIGKQRFAAAWRPAFGTFTKIDSEYNDIVVRGLKENQGTKATMIISSLKNILSLTESGDKLWSGTRNMDMTDVKLEISGVDNGTITIDRVSAGGRMDKLDLAAAGDMNRKLGEFLKNGNPTPEQKKAFLDDILKNANSMGDSMSSTLEIKGIRTDVVPGKDPQLPTKSLEPFRFSLEKLSSVFDVKGMSQEKGGAKLGFSVDGLKAEGQPEETAGLVPLKLNIEIAFDDLPMKELSNSFVSLMRQSMEAAMAAEQAADPVQKSQMEAQSHQDTIISMAAIPQLLVNAGSSLTIRDTYFSAADLSSTLEGKFTASQSSALPATGTLTLTLEGLDEFIQKLQTLSEKPSAAGPRAAGIAQALVILQLQGQLGEGSGGKTLRTYKFDATPQGKMLLNGVDISMLANALGGGVPGAAPAPQTGHGLTPGEAPAVP